MIHSLNGTIIAKTPADIVVVCGGVGFYVMIPSSAYAALPDIGDEGVVFTHLNVKEDNLELFGFSSEHQRDMFRMLTSVSGVGPKVGLGMLSLYDSDSIALSIASGDFKTLKNCPNVGPKLAQRIVLELKDKIGNIGGGAVVQAVSAVVEKSAGAEAVAALVSLGFSQTEASSAVARQPQDMSVEQTIAAALRALGSR